MAHQAASESGHGVEISADGVRLAADLALPPDARAVVVFAHGSGSGRFSPRNRAVAGVLNRAGLATVLLDLLTAGEEALDVRTRHLRFDVALLGRRVIATIDWLASDATTKELPVGCFGASTGAAAALIAAAGDQSVRAVVSRGGRPDLAGDALHDVEAPTLMIVGGRDPRILKANQLASRELSAPHRIEVIPGATHLFEEPGALERVAALAAAWFGEHVQHD
jgi:putative phosphoribosyl transferase